MVERKGRGKAEKEPQVGGESPGGLYATWAECCMDFSRALQESYEAFFKPWLRAAEKAAAVAAKPPKKGTEAYKKFYNPWFEAYKETFGKIGEEALSGKFFEELVKSTNKNMRLYSSWVEDLGKLSDKTLSLMQNPDPKKYWALCREWVEVYERIYSQSLSPSFFDPMKISLRASGVPEEYINALLKLGLLWRESYEKLWKPWFDFGIRAGETLAAGEDGEELYKLWTETFLQGFKNVSAMPSREDLEKFQESMNIYLELYRSYIKTIEKMTQRILSSPEQSYRAYYDLWLDMYEKAFQGFFTAMPMLGPYKELFEPVRRSLDLYSRTWLNLSKFWVNSYLNLFRS